MFLVDGSAGIVVNVILACFTAIVVGYEHGLRMLISSILCRVESDAPCSLRTKSDR